MGMDKAVVRARSRGASLAGALASMFGAGALITALSTTVDVGVGHALSQFTRSDVALRIEVTARQWWWEAEYEGGASPGFTTANEIHIPVGEPVLLELRSADVVHSFRVPGIHEVRDLEPGYTRSFWIEAPGPGVFRSECAELCGHQHAQMTLLIVAEPAEDFARWYEAQLAPAAEPAGELAALGRQVFRDSGCAGCHGVRGLADAGPRGAAAAGVGPDLTHLGSRRNIASRPLRDLGEPLGAWILEPHTVKPSVKMPRNDLSMRELDALLAYLGGLH
jgi:cytochrome c oxidase subunit 2